MLCLVAEFRHIRSFEQYCDLSRQFDPTPSPAILPDGTVVPAWKGPGIDTFVAQFGRQDLLDFSEIPVFVWLGLKSNSFHSAKILDQPGCA